MGSRPRAGIAILRDLSPDPRRAAADAGPPDPADAVAVVVGIDRYGGDPRSDLAGPVADAVRFVRWFSAVGVPAERIVLLASPADAPVPEVPSGVGVLPADRATVRKVLVRQVARQEHRTLFVVWGGHGFVDLQRRRRLYYADTDPDDDPVDLDLDSLLARFASTRVPRLDRQFWIVDACQVHGPGGPAPRVAAHETFEAGDPAPGRAQDVLFAAGLGQPAVDLAAQRTGVFSREVLRILEADGVAAFGTLAQRLRDVFAGLRAQRRTAQTPTVLWYRSAAGDEGHLLGQVPAVAGPEPDLRALAPAVDALVAIPEFQRPHDREVVLSQLRGPIYTLIPRNQVARLEAINVIRTCLRFPGGVTELIEAVRFFAAGTPAMDRFEEAARRLEEPAQGSTLSRRTGTPPSETGDRVTPQADETRRPTYEDRL